VKIFGFEKKVLVLVLKKSFVYISASIMYRFVVKASYLSEVTGFNLTRLHCVGILLKYLAPKN